MKGKGVRSWRAGLVGAVFIFGMSGLASVPGAAQAAVQQITDCTTEGSASAPGTLAYAVAQGGTWAFACSGTGPFTIVFNTKGTLDVPAGRTVVLGGGGAAVSLSGGGSTELFAVEGSLTLDGLTLENGSPNGGGGNGGAIDNFGALTVSNSTFSDNSTSAYSAFGSGGAIANTGTLTVSNSTFSGNSATGGDVGAFGGGAIVNLSGTATVSNSTFYGNSAPVFGGAITVETGTLTVSNSTFSGNSARYGGNLSILSPYGSETLYNTIVANATSGGNCYGSFAGHNDLEYGDATNTCAASTSGWVTGNPDLGPLQDNGGSTQTMALGFGSAAIGAGDPTVCASAPVNGFDQRGVARGTTTATCDIGAYQTTAPSQADLAARYALQPSPIAPAGTLASGQTVAATVDTETYNGAVAPDVPLYLSFTGGTGSATVGGVALTATPQLFTSDGAGHVVVQYTAGTAPTGSATDALTVADAAASPTLQGSDSYSYAATFTSLGALAAQFETQPGIANALSAKLGAAAAAAARGNTRAMHGALDAFEHAVTAQGGKTITGAQAAILIREAQQLQQ